MIRLNKFLALNLNISRRSADELISKQLIHVNGLIAQIGQKIDDKKDEVIYLGNKVEEEIKKYVMFYKPPGYICSHKKQGSAPTIYDIISDTNLKYAGRLDKESEGLLLLSNDGDWINKLTHPKYQIKKIYHVTVEEEINLDTFKTVIEKENKLYQINNIKKMKSYVYELVLTTGKKREIREIFQYNKVAINRLKRVQMGEYSLENMQPGDIKELDLS